MLKKIVDFFTSNHNILSARKIILLLLGLALFLRFPFFFRDYIDRDESTFIIMAQSWVNGHLPYTQLWDLKPPITFLFFASIIYVFGKSFIAIRFFGAIIVAVSAFFTYKIGAKMASKKIGLLSGTAFVILQSMFGSVQGVMSEHISTVFFCSALYLLISRKSWFWYLFSGLLMGLSIMSKLNMAYPTFFIGLLLLYKILREKSFKQDFLLLSVWAIGILFLVALTAIPYYVQNQVVVWWQSIFEAPLAYSSSKYNSVLNVLPFCLIVGILFLILLRTKKLNYKERDVQLLLVVIAGIVLSFVQAGKVNGHYLIQLYPFLLILVGTAVAQLKWPARFRFTPYLMLLPLFLPIEAYLEYANILKNKMEKGTFYNGEGIEIPQYILNNTLNTENIFFLEYHIGYWILEEIPPTKAATHPSNITRDNLYPFMGNSRNSSKEELIYILEVLQPKTIVIKKGKRIFDKKFPGLNDYMTTYLEKNYAMIKSIGRGQIYQRLE